MFLCVLKPFLIAEKGMIIVSVSANLQAGIESAVIMLYTMIAR